ncbi:hypothetical protein [Maribacter sp. 4G9]|uniref:hypothetical protein n=1 Tax=Maribacter sp. 4G9 TaxID=1889777 RepID=UPI000C4A2575|nr:hypothetical protein [Maribacter sp. 4G9]PIB30612.1 hypothetical protein BFP75_02445 [Maribacter sp. 4G9]
MEKSGPSLEFLKEYQISSLPLLDTVSYIKDGRRLQDWRNYNFNELSLEQKQALSLDTIVSLGDKRDRRNIGPEGLNNLITEISNKLPISDNFSTYIFFSLYRIQPTYTLITYDNNYKIIDAKIIGQFNDSRHKLYRYITDNIIRIRTDWYDGHRANITFIDYVIDSNGKIIQQNEIQPRSESWGRAVKAKNGLVVRDSLGEKIGKYNFGDFAIIKGYSEDSISIVDNGETINGRRAEVILDYQKYLNQFLVPSSENNIGYVFEGYLFDSNGFFSNQVDYKIEDPNLYYYANYILIGGQYHHSNINLKEFMEIVPVSLEKYLPKVIKEEVVYGDKYFANDKNSFELSFLNGTSKFIKDSVYKNQEYSPTSHNELFENKDLDNYYGVFNSFFEEQYFYLLDKQDGKKVHQFIDYPLVSPKKEIIVSLSTPFTYETASAILEITRINEEKFYHDVTVDFVNWNIPYNKHIYWLSDIEFILKVQQVGRAFSKEESPKFFYLKFKIK